MDIKILATDLDSNVLAKGREGAYSLDRIERLSIERKKRFFERSTRDVDVVKVKPLVRELITFNRLNLLDEWPIKNQFDIIFCRNVVIYFNRPTQQVLFDRFADKLVNGGYLFIGHSENLYNITQRFKLLGKTIYQKVE